MEVTSYPASVIAARMASSDTSPVTMAVLESRSTVAVTPGKSFRALVTCLTQFWHIMPSTIIFFSMLFSSPFRLGTAQPSDLQVGGMAHPLSAPSQGQGSWMLGLKNRRRRALVTTQTELRLMAAAANMGESWSWNRG